MTKDKQQELFKSILVPDCPEELHRQVKIQAAVEGIPLKELVKKALREYLARQQKGKRKESNENLPSRLSGSESNADLNIAKIRSLCRGGLFSDSNGLF